MKIIHGENVIASRQSLINSKNHLPQNSEPLELDGQQLTLTDLKNYLNTQSLFGTTQTLFVENFFSRRESAEKKQIIAYLLENQSAPITFWDSCELTTPIKGFLPILLEKHDLPKYLYQYIDTFSLSLLQKTLAATPPEVVLALMVRHLHNLILIKTGEVSSFPAWQAKKLQTQSGKYPLPKLLELYQALYRIDISHKNSKSPLSLAGQLEVWTAMT